MSALEGWMAMRVTRKHTLPYHTKESLAAHTWGVMHLLLYIHPNAPASLLRKALYHDIGEYRAGDVPGDFKANNPEVAEACDDVEVQAAYDVLPEILHDSQKLNMEETFLIKIADKIEFAFSCYDEWMMGNRYAIAPMERTVEIASKYVRNHDAIYSTLDPLIKANIGSLINEAYRLLQEVRGDHNLDRKLK